MPANRYPRQVASCFSITAPDIAASFCQFHLYMGLRQRALVAAPNIFVSAQVAAWTDDKARYIRNRGLDDGYRELIVDYLKRYGQASRQEIDALLLPKLPDVLDATQQGHKIRNLMQPCGAKASFIGKEAGQRQSGAWQWASLLAKALKS